MERWVKGMRDVFFDSLFEIAKKDPNVILITSDTGAICHDEIRESLPKQYINIGIAEQNLIGVAAGLALTGKIVYIYAIVPFVTMRCYEQIRVDLCCMNLPVTCVGVGAGFDYSTLGPTHHGTEDIALMRVVPGMTIFSPSDSIMADLIAKETYKLPGPKYVRLDRTGYPLIYNDKNNVDCSKGLSILRSGEDLCLISTGRMVYQSLQVAECLSKNHSVTATVVDLFRIKPLNEQLLLEIIEKTKFVATLEEHFISGGIGSAVGEVIIDSGKNLPLKRFGIPDQFCRRYGSREYLQRLHKLDVDSIAEALVKNKEMVLR